MFPSLEGKRILVAEDVWLIAVDMAGAVRAAGGSVIGPVSRVQDGQSLLTSTVDGAILDIALADGLAWPLADRLNELRAPFVLATAGDKHGIPDRFSTVPVFQKPCDPWDIIGVLARTISVRLH